MGNELAKNDKRSLIEKFSDRYAVDGNKMFETLKATAFKQRDGSAPSNEQMMALLVVADQYKLNPFTREIYAFPDKNNGIVPVVGVDGWSRIINSHAQFDGMEFRYSDETTVPEGAKSPAHEWVECVMYRKDRSRPVVVREYLDEVYRAPFKQGVLGPWQTHTKRFHRHKTMIQAARLAFGFVGIFDEDEAGRISEQTERDNVVEGQFEEAKQLPEYDDARFDANFAKYSKAIAEGQKTADDIIAAIETRYTMTQQQKDTFIEFELDVQAQQEEQA